MIEMAQGAADRATDDSTAVPAPSEFIDLGFLRETFDDAQSAITGLWEPSGKTFWRSTVQRERELARGSVGEFYPTVTLRCIDSILLLVSEAPSWTATETLRLLHETLVPSIIERTADDLRRSTLNVSDQPNVFTLSTYSQTFGHILGLKDVQRSALDEARARFTNALGTLLSHEALADANVFALHPFLAYRVRQALSEAELRADKSIIPQLNQVKGRVARHCRESIARNLAKHQIGALNPSEAIALAFCAASLVGVGPRFDEQPPPQTAPVLREDYQLVRAALVVALASQDSAGCWPLGRVIEENKDITSQRLEITTFEVASAVAEASAGLLATSSSRMFDPITTEAIRRLLQSARYAERSLVRLDDNTFPRIGWCSDHAYGAHIIESWTSATVLESVLRLSGLVQEFNRRSVHTTFTTTDPKDRDWPQWLRWSSYKVSGEVDRAHSILRYLDEKLVQPILAEPRRLPSARARTVSVLLFGPPGTSKTTISKAVAEGLGWPVVLLNPGSFIDRGLEYIETQARSVFDRLIQLSRAVVVFDECDELFRGRQPRPESEQMRGITAFVTASMLPKLQELHDTGRVVFFICTNNFDAMDPAVKRGGRVDHIIGVGPPDHDARQSIIASAANELRKRTGWREPPFLDDSADELASTSETFTRPEIERALGALVSLAEAANWLDAASARAAARLLTEDFRDGLTITPTEYQEFREQCKKFSHAHIRSART